MDIGAFKVQLPNLIYLRVPLVLTHRSLYLMWYLPHPWDAYLNYCQLLFVVSHLPQNLGIWKMALDPI